MTLIQIKHSLFAWNKSTYNREYISSSVLLFFLKHCESIHQRTLWISNQHGKNISEHLVSELFKWYVSGTRSGPSSCHLNSASKPNSEVHSHARHLAECTKECYSSRSAHWSKLYWRVHRNTKLAAAVCVCLCLSVHVCVCILLVLEASF